VKHVREPLRDPTRSNTAPGLLVAEHIEAVVTERSDDPKTSSASSAASA
jgi:hypothetical protein